MAIDRQHQVPIPDRNRYPITINRGDHNKVLYVLDAPFDRQKGYAVPQRTVIGYVCPDDQSKMYPTDKYKIIFSRDWERQTGKKVTPMVKKVGLFCAFRAIDKKINLFKYIHEAFGMDTGNRILDFVLYSILFKSASFAEMQQVISDQMLFSSGVRSDSFYSGLFKSSIPENSILNFKKMWAQHCRRLGVEEVWLCIDGSNDDCESKGVELAEKGHAKSHRNSNIVSFSYAVTSSGMPVTFNVYRGGLVDAKAMMEIIAFLTECNIRLCGVILDRGYCNSRTMKYLSAQSIPYIIMVKGTPKGAEDIVQEYGQKIKMNAEYLVPGTNLFGIQKACQVFQEYKHTDYLTLFFDFQNASDRIATLIGHINREMRRLDKLLRKYNDEMVIYEGLTAIENKESEKVEKDSPDKNSESSEYSSTLACDVKNHQNTGNAKDDADAYAGKNSNSSANIGSDKKQKKEVKPPKLPVISENVSNYILIVKDESTGCMKAEINTANLQESLNEKGLYQILSSEQMSPAKIDSLYTSRTSSEVQYRIVKTELGYGQIRIHFTPSLYAKFAVGFIASIIRYQLQSYARSISKNTSDIIREMNLLTAVKINDTYTYSHVENERQINLLKFFGCDVSLFDSCVKEENAKLNGNAPAPRRRKPGPKPGVIKEHPEKETEQKNDSTSPVQITLTISQKKDHAEVSEANISEITSATDNDQNRRDDPELELSSIKDSLERVQSVKQESSQLNESPRKRGVKPGTKRGEFNKDGSPRQKPGVPAGTKRCDYKLNGEPRAKPGPKPKSE